MFKVTVTSLNHDLKVFHLSTQSAEGALSHVVTTLRGRPDWTEDEIDCSTMHVSRDR